MSERWTWLSLGLRTHREEAALGQLSSGNCQYSGVRSISADGESRTPTHEAVVSKTTVATVTPRRRKCSRRDSNPQHSDLKSDLVTN